MDYAKLNELLRNLDSLRNGKPVETHKEEYESSWYEIYNRTMKNVLCNVME